MWSSSGNHSAHSSKSSSTHSNKEVNDSTDNSVKELSSDEEEDKTPTPTPVNELYDSRGWNEATEPLDFTTSRHTPQMTDNGDNRHHNSQRLIGPQLVSSQVSPHSCCHCMSSPYEECLSTSRVFHMTETTNHLPAVVAKRNYRVCDHCGLTCAHMFFEPMASTYWDHVVPHHHTLHQNFHYRKVFHFEYLPILLEYLSFQSIEKLFLFKKIF